MESFNYGPKSNPELKSQPGAAKNLDNLGFEQLKLKGKFSPWFDFFYVGDTEYCVEGILCDFPEPDVPVTIVYQPIINPNNPSDQ
jgi:hypothetical protein